MDAVIIIDEQSRIIDWSGQAGKTFGWSREEAVGQPLTSLIVPPRYWEAHARGMETYLRTGKGRLFSKRFEISALHRDGHELPVEVSISELTLAGKNHFSAFLRDISERKRSEAKIQRDYHAQRVIASVLDASLSPIPLREKLEQSLDLVLSVPWLDLEAKGCIFLADSAERTLTMEAQHGLPKDLLSACAKVEYGRCLCGCAIAAGETVFTDCLGKWHETTYDGISEHGHYCVPIRLGDDTLGLMNLYVEEDHTRNTDDEHFLSAVTHALAGMIKRHQAEHDLQRNAFFDLLTDLPNRALLKERLERSMRRLQRQPEMQLAILFLDLDRFKNVNDSLGHAAGDRLLIEVARRLEHCIRPGDTVARLGGDEFTLLLEDIGEDADALRVAGRVHAGLAEPVRIDGHEVFVSASVGIALSTSKQREAQNLLRDADIAMYRAKSSGPGKTEVFDRSMHDHAVALLKMETDLRLAVDRDEIHVHYQPIIATATGRIVGFEALARWDHPQRGRVLPGEFIPVAEESGLIDAVAGQVLGKACRQMAAWLAEFPERADLYVCVNLSAQQLTQPGLVERIDRTLAENGLAPCNLRLEITENALMQDADLLGAALGVFKDRAIGLHLDDFGTGYSSLGYLHRFPFSALKVDQSFVAGMTATEGYVGLVRAIIALAGNFGMEVIAEGVETPEQLEMLRQLECRIVQGYLFSPAVSGAQAGGFLADGCRSGET
jgi:diguanylate cyclase (GGDEF)-like protein/PAS domain S-box-containing protein